MSNLNYPCDPEGQITYDHAYWPQVSMSRNGNIVISWVEWQCSECENVKARIFNSNGDPVTNEFQVNTFQTVRGEPYCDQWLTTPAINDSGDIAIVWGSQYQENGSAWTEGGGIYGRLYNYNSGSSPLTGEFHINTAYQQDDQFGTNVAMRSNGDFIVAWQSNGQDCGGRGIYAKQYDSSGNPIGSEFRVNTYNSIMLDSEEIVNSGSCIKMWSERIGITMNEYGDFVLVWPSYDYEQQTSYGWTGGPASYGEGYGIYANIYFDIDGDDDGISEDGDVSGVIGDNPCVGGNTINCDDNCPDDYNPYQEDMDSDAIGDICDADRDGDGMPDAWEVAYGLDPNDPADASYDYDGDGLTNLEEYINGSSPLLRTECVDCPSYFYGFYSRAIAIDSIDRPHIAYGGDRLYHAYHDGIEWQYETVDGSGGVGEFASIVIDSNNNMHISYQERTGKDLKYATNKSGAWVIETADSAGYVGLFTSIAIDSNDNVHISYYDYTNAELKYATNESGAWVTETVDSAGAVGFYTSIAIDSNNKVHLSYYDGTNYDLKYATNKDTCTNPPVRIGSAYFTTLQAAYDAAVDGNIIQSQEVTLAGDLNINRNITVTMEGGYNCDYTTVSSETRLNGNMTINDGKVIIDSGKLVIE